jgi:hypothetical protein
MKTMKTMKTILFLLVISVHAYGITPVSDTDSISMDSILKAIHSDSIRFEKSQFYGQMRVLRSMKQAYELNTTMQGVTLKDVLEYRNKMKEKLCDAIRSYFALAGINEDLKNEIYYLKHLEWYDLIYEYADTDNPDFKIAKKLQQLKDRYTVSRLLQNNQVFQEVYNN